MTKFKYLLYYLIIPALVMSEFKGGSIVFDAETTISFVVLCFILGYILTYIDKNWADTKKILKTFIRILLWVLLAIVVLGLLLGILGWFFALPATTIIIILLVLVLLK